MRPLTNRSLSLLPVLVALLARPAAAKVPLDNAPAPVWMQAPPADPGVELASTADQDEPEAAALPNGPAEALPLPDLSVLTAKPVRGARSSGFGWRDDPIRHRRKFHCGTDYRAPRGTPVYVAAEGTVVFAGRRGGYGRSIDVVHGPGLLTRYAHLSKILVSRGQRVAADDEIGKVGSTGRATGPHLHFEVRIHGRPVQPALAQRVGVLQRTAPPEQVAVVAAALRPEVQEQHVSEMDPPRARHLSRRKAKHPVHRRRRHNLS